MLRTEHRLSQGDLAEKMGVSRQSVSKWETGSSVFDLDKLVALSELFDVSLDTL
ncbi:MAG: helix-turn-helix transcriptional regulator [Tepidanaerobacteraceae bacterium]|nr:helix-turn-helix transcriptional regulator [Tepidanaerobacteraceae bacterium]